MGRFIARRLVSLIFVLIGMSLITFTIVRLVPSDPVSTAFGFDAVVSDEQRQKFIEQKGWDKPLPLQYWNYLTGVLSGDLGTSLRTNRPVLQEIKDFLPASIELAAASIVLYVPGGVLLGLLAARRVGGKVDAVVRLFAIAGVATPVFWLALLLQLLFYRSLRLFPSGGRIGWDVGLDKEITNFYLIDSLLTWNMPAFLSSLHHIALPAITLSLANIGLLTRITRSSLLDVLQTDYIRTARSKGLTSSLVQYRHALPNALIPIITIIGLQFASLIAYVFLVEVVFSWPGVGSYAIDAIIGLDFDAIMGVTLIFSFIYVVLNFCVDMAYLVIDPRTRVQ